ncbi:MAG: molybdopterin molybdotransferase MoeA [Clostridiales bacterium]|nr:molybdopterin molybdotransferase MoeA [Clostridiales bacterium]
MQNNISADRARDMLLELPVLLKTEKVKLEASHGRILASDVYAEIPVPPFDRSPYDGYAFRGEDTVSATKEKPAILEITEEIPAGEMPEVEITPGKAAKILTGAPMPKGANATVKYEITEYTDKWVKIFEPVSPDTDIVYAGEDIKKGELIASGGTVIDPPLAGLLACQGVCDIQVYKKPTAIIINTGSELVEAGNPLPPAKIYNSNVYTLMGYLRNMGMLAHNGGTVDDDPELIASAITQALEKSDVVITTGGSSVGDYDWSLKAFGLTGARVLFWKVAVKPGGAMLAAVKDNKLILGLSGNPGAAVLGLFRVAMPYLRKLCGRTDILPETVELFLEKSFNKASKPARLIRGRLVIKDGKAFFSENEQQGNGSVSSLSGCDLIAELPAGSPPQPAGAVVKAYVVKGYI